ncbi:MAG: hypothetical protein NW200_10080 [Hyphomonadaceae bacterium]|nr:hypothetical protein [Hyphomonadaceae bacterium]
MENHLTKVPAHMVSLVRERTVRMRVDPTADAPLATPVAVAPGERRPFATVDLGAMRWERGFGVAPD